MAKIWLLLCLLTLTGDAPALSPEARAAAERAEQALVAADLATAEREIAAALALAPDSPPLYNLYRATLRTPEQAKGARERYAALAAREPDRIGYLYMHGRLVEEMAERERAFARIAALDPNGPWGDFGLAWVARLKGDPERALTLYERALATAPDEPAIVSALVGHLAHRIQTEASSPKVPAWRERATKLFDDRLVAKAPRSYHAYVVYPSMIYVSPAKKGVAYAERFVKTFPKAPYAATAYQVVLDDLMARDQAAATARARAALAELPAAVASPARDAIFTNYVFAPAATKGLAAVEALAIEMLATAERSSGIFYLLGARYAVEGDTALGIRLLSRALELSATAPDPLSPPDKIRVALGRTYLRAGDAARAAETLDAVASPAHLAVAAAGAAEAHERLGNTAKVYEATVRAVAASPTPEMEARLVEVAKAAGKTEGEATAAVWATRDAVAKPAPDFTLMGLDGVPLTLSSLRGKVVLLTFWFPG